MYLSDDKQAGILDAFKNYIQILGRYFKHFKIMFVLTIWEVKYTLQSSNLIKQIPLLRKPRIY